MMNKRKKNIIICICVVIIIFILGFAIKNSNDKKVIGNATTKAITSTPLPALSASSKDQVKVLLKQLSGEKKVLGYQIYEENNKRYAIITFKVDADIKNAKDFASKYGKSMQQAYNDKNIIVQILQNGKNIAYLVLK